MSSDVNNLRNRSVNSSAGGSLYPGENEENYLTFPVTNSVWQQQMLLANNRRAEDQSCCLSLDGWRNLILKLIFMLTVGVALILSCFALRFSTYGPRRLHLNGGDQLLVPVSTHFNKEAYFHAVTNHSQDLRLHMFPDTPPIAAASTQYTYTQSFQMGSWSYQFWGLRLLAGSSVNISVCADLHMQFYVLAGEKKLQAWTQQTLYSNYDYHANIPPRRSCEKISAYKTLTLHAQKSQVYYLLFSSSVGWRFFTTVYVSLDFNRCYYDESTALYSCVLSDSACFARYNASSRNIVMLDASGHHTQVFRKHTLRLTHKPRIEFYAWFYGCIYISILSVTILYTIWRALTDRCLPRDHRSLTTSHPAVSLRSHAGRLREADWLVVSTVADTKTNRTVEIVERDAISLAQSSVDMHDSGSSDENHQQQQLSGSMRSRHDSWLEYYRQQNDSDQQLIDSCMTSAGVSAI